MRAAGRSPRPYWQFYEGLSERGGGNWFCWKSLQFQNFFPHFGLRRWRIQLFFLKNVSFMSNCILASIMTIPEVGQIGNNAYPIKTMLSRFIFRLHCLYFLPNVKSFYLHDCEQAFRFVCFVLIAFSTRLGSWGAITTRGGRVKSFHSCQGAHSFTILSWTLRLLLLLNPDWKNLFNQPSTAFVLPWLLPRLRLSNKVIKGDF